MKHIWRIFWQSGAPKPIRETFERHTRKPNKNFSGCSVTTQVKHSQTDYEPMLSQLLFFKAHNFFQMT